MHSTFTSSHTMWAATKVWLQTAASATCYTTVEKARLSMIYNGNSSTHGFSSGVYITTADCNHLEKAWTKMLVSKNYLGA